VRRINLRALRFSLSLYLSRFFKSLLSILLLLLQEMRSVAISVLCVSLGCAMIARVLYPGIEWGVGIAAFGALSLVLRDRKREREETKNGRQR